MIYKDSVRAPRWADLPGALRKLAWTYDLDIELFERKGIIRTEVFFTVEGEEGKIESFKESLLYGVNNYNRGG